MHFEIKLNDIIKKEKNQFIIFILLSILLLTFLLFMILDKNNASTYFNLISFILFYLCILTVVIRKFLILKELKWSLNHYHKDPHYVKIFLRTRKANLVQYKAQHYLYHLYEEAIHLVQTVINEIEYENK